MKQKDVLEVEVAAALKSARTAIRLRHSLAADAEINERLPEIEAEIMAAAVAGKPYKVDLGALVASA